MPVNADAVRMYPMWMRSHPRLMIAIAIAFLAYFLAPVGWVVNGVTRWIIAWNIGAVLYLLLALQMMFASTHEKMRQRAIREDDGRFWVLLLVVVSALTCIGAIFAELAVVKDLHGVDRVAHIALAALTIASSWFFTQTMFALHCAHDFYLATSRSHQGGLIFPGDQPPDYSDFFYFSCVIGTSGQTADVSFSSRSMRRIGAIHCILAFFFNTTVIALTINIASSLV
ncbi:DUF1345 domain-containing protein [Leeia sp. TBRC 13508]|uniref:DUF1345 domain-containing protein n=1 Tax=Leeia speluncae TaxID=2884804 RepID=A0ABS8D1H6_9NEIS|nr:DUF1345 domain-containing protein [Leeia speluncae]MCB6182047.1 DUF1345 domain-containing protein [Leeia speluncae]